jgi:hypothetical protein
MSGQSREYLVFLMGTEDAQPDSLALEREHGDPRTDIAVQIIQAWDAVRCRDKY